MPGEKDYSVWVGDLTPDVDDLSLFKFFSARFQSVKSAKGTSLSGHTCECKERRKESLLIVLYTKHLFSTPGDDLQLCFRVVERCVSVCAAPHCLHSMVGIPLTEHLLLLNYCEGSHSFICHPSPCASPDSDCGPGYGGDELIMRVQAGLSSEETTCVSTLVTAN